MMKIDSPFIKCDGLHPHTAIYALVIGGPFFELVPNLTQDTTYKRTYHVQQPSSQGRDNVQHL